MIVLARGEDIWMAVLGERFPKQRSRLRVLYIVSGQVFGYPDPDLVGWVRGLVAFRPRLLKGYKNHCFWYPRLQNHSKANGFSSLGRKAIEKT